MAEVLDIDQVVLVVKIVIFRVALAVQEAVVLFQVVLKLVALVV